MSIKMPSSSDAHGLGVVLTPDRMSGDESFTARSRPESRRLSDFWKWMGSDLVSNTMRGVLAEFIVACDLGVADKVRTEWESYDLRTPSGLTVEVKSAAYCQSWFQKRYSDIRFSIAPTRRWNAETGELTSNRKRQADAYVFALLHHKDKMTLDPLNLDQWTFYVLATAQLNRLYPERKALTLNALLEANPVETGFGGIGKSIEVALARSQRTASDR